MKFEANKSDLSRAAALVSSTLPSGVEGKQSTVTLRAKGDRVVLEAGSTGLIFATEVEATVELEGAATMLAQRFADTVTQSSHTLRFELSDGKLEITSHDVRWSERAEREQPRPAPVVPEAEARFFSQEMVTAISTVRHSLSKETLQPRLHALDIERGKVRASNGTNYQEFRLSTKDLTFSVGVLLVDPLLKVLKVWQSEVVFSHDETRLFFACGRDLLVLNKPINTFPDLDRLVIRPLRAQATYVLKIRKAEAEAALRKVKVGLSTNHKAVELHMTSRECVFRTHGDHGEVAVAKIEANWAGTPRVAVFDHKALHSAIASANTEVLEVKLAKDTRDRRSPLTIEGEGTWSMVNQLRISSRS